MENRDAFKEIKREIDDIVPFEEDDDEWQAEGYCFLKGKRFKHAERKFQELIAAQPNHHDGYEGLGFVYNAMGKKDKAIFFMRRAVEIARSFLEDDSIDVEVISEMEDNLNSIKEDKAPNEWWRTLLK